MDKAFWQNIIDNECAIPTGESIMHLTAELLSYLESSDTELREGPVYTILAKWLKQGSYSHAELWEMATQLLRNLAIGLGKQQDDTIFLRSFSALILSEIVENDLIHLMLSETEVQLLLEQALAYFLAEKDLRGYEYGKGWAHAIAHCADLLWNLARHPLVSVAGLTQIMNALAEKITAPVAHIYLYDEDERLARIVMGALQRDQLTLPFLTTWLEQLMHPSGRIAWNETWESGKIMEIVRSKVETSTRHNIKHFLRSLYFQLRFPGFADLTSVEQSPPVTDEFLPLVENVLSQIRSWC